MVRLSDKTARYSFTAPLADKQIIDWIQTQQNLSLSLRLVIKDYIARHGVSDIMCMPMMIDDEAVVTGRKNGADENQNKVNTIESTIKEDVIQKEEPVTATPEPIVKAVEPPKTATDTMMDDMLADLMK